MERSQEIRELAEALSKAQSEISGAHKDCDNTFFNSKYADLSSVWDACRAALTKNGLSVVQILGREGTQVSCETTLLHSSGQFIASTMEMAPSKTDPQGIGSCSTYLRRYTLSAMVGVSPEDDEGNSDSDSGHRSNIKQPQRKEASNEPETESKATKNQIKRLWAISYKSRLTIDHVKAKYGLKSLNDLLASDYEEACKTFEDNPKEDEGREPGDEG